VSSKSQDGGKSVIIVPARVAGPTVQRVVRAAPETPVVVSAQPTVVPLAHVVPVIPAQITAEQVDHLRRENEMLREELSRVRSD
jgi:hypothetical protein